MEKLHADGPLFADTDTAPRQGRRDKVLGNLRTYSIRAMAFKSEIGSTRSAGVPIVSGILPLPPAKLATKVERKVVSREV
jgi:hypothetical protein